ncbi:hypothetical protein BDM02DRAFT_3270577 [Thelephora ganbajun]|uniref:Uncharacterized protein n=1 Tax=Thelephora ganbajun TaxID=370292 RepID=A0ACB6ZBS9_THEGA|nr:hypothetical protein BDM02DRAFT_3270577 [Thelephora ganbajun]
MDTDPAAANHVNRLEHTSPSELAAQLPLLFEKLLGPDQEPRLMYSYVVSLRRVFSRERQGVENPESPSRGFSRFGRAALNAGLVPTMKSIIATVNQGNYFVLAIYYGIDTLTRLCNTGTLEQKRALAKQILEHDVLTVIYDRLENYPYFIVRIVASEFLATMSRGSDCFACCRACLAGPGQAEEEMNDPSRRWTTRHVWEGQRRMTIREAVHYAPRRFGILQENVFFGVMDLVAPLPVRKRTTVLEMVRKRPQILGQMLAIASETRPPWHPETQVYSIAAECFASLVNLPMDRVPGVPISVEGGIQREVDEEWAAALEVLRMVTTIPGWINKVYAMWDRVESEPWMAIQVLLDRITDHHNVKDPNALYHILRQRGTSRLSVLRAVVSLTYAPDSVPDFFVLAFLRVAYACSPKPVRLEDIPPTRDGLNTLNLSTERTQEVWRKPHWAATEDHNDPNYSSILYREEFAGPIAFLRLLLLLSERGLLSKIPSWSTVPSYNGDAIEPGVKKPSVSQLKQVTSPAVIRKFVSMSLKRAKELREVYGRKEVQEGKLGDARLSYACASELSVAIVAFLESPEAETELKSRFLDDAKKELVLCLGNAAEMSIRERKHRRDVRRDN